MPTGEHRAMVDALTIAPTGAAAPDPITFSSAIGTISGRPEIYQPILECLRHGPVSVRALREAPPFAARPAVEVLQAVSLLIAGGYAHPVLPDPAAGRDGARRLNRTVAAVNAGGGDLPRLVMPLIGSSLQVDVVETLLAGELLAGKPADPAALTTDLLALLSHGDRTMQRDGKPLTDPADIRQLAGELVRQFLDQRVPVLRGLGVLDA
jgi:hypothetical protein